MWNRKNQIEGKLWVISLLVCMCLMGCSDDDNITPEQPTAQGTFVDVRDGKEYHYVHLSGLDWSVENLSYDLDNLDLCRVYQDVDNFQEGVYSTAYREKYGMLYTYEGALQAVPEGWRLPTDDEWAALERSYGYLSDSFGLLYAGYFTKNAGTAADNGSRFMGAWAYFWTSSGDDSKEGEYYFARKKFYNNQQMERLSIEPTAHFLSVRFVR